MQIAICDDEVFMVQILEEKIKKLLPDAVIDKYLSGDEPVSYTHLDVYKRQGMWYSGAHDSSSVCHIGGLRAGMESRAF